MSPKNVVLNDKLIKLSKDFFSKEKIQPEFVESVFEELVTETDIIYGDINIDFSFTGLEGREGISFSSEGFGKVFELTGTNQRFKTTSLIIIALILNYNFIDAEHMLASNQLVSKVNELTKQLFSRNKFQVDFSLSSQTASFHFTKKENEISIQMYEKQQVINLNLNDYNEVFQKYVSIVHDLELADVQFVSKGRNFVGQVHREITNEFIITLDSIKDKVEITVNKFMENINYSDNYKEEAQIKNEISYIIKAINLLNDITVDFPSIDSVIQLKRNIPEDIKNKKIDELIILKNEYMVKLQEISLNINGNQNNMIAIKSTLDNHLFNLNAYSDLPYRFSIENLPFRIQSFLIETEGFLSTEEGIEIISIRSNKEIKKMAIHNISGKFFNSPITINTTGDYEIYIKTLKKIHLDIQNLREYTLKSKDGIEYSLKVYVDLEESQRGLIASKVFYENLLNNIDQLIALCHEIVNVQKNDQIEELLNKITKGTDFINYRNLFKCIEKTDFDYSGENKDQLLINLNTYKIELEVSLEMNSGKFLLPKKLRDINTMTKFLQDIRAVTEYLQVEDLAESKSSLMIAEASLKTNLHSEVLQLFNNYMYERCKYYFEVLDANNVLIHPLLSYDFENRQFFIKDRKVSTSEGISGGTDSAMTVRSFASKKNNTEFGLVLLIDEWGDVGAELASKVYQSILEINTFGFGVFVKVDPQLNKARLDSM
ncbi:hypothetical protein [Paenibacillus silagei]|uniref:ATP-binding protein n=1 Tax=Paenibacillus silagei TaxID=1670801 RepID=A0ABS4NTJ8_9BACL|nr:hypothetical protein [Paenibacillus silagei]MBP2113388.1 hypothetical protein [Paenibacillus silagei]